MDGPPSMAVRARELKERQAANVVANQRSRQRSQLKRGEAPAIEAPSTRTLSRAKMLQAQRSGSGTRTIAAPEIRTAGSAGAGMRSSSSGSDGGGGGGGGGADGHSVARSSRQHDRRERGAAHRTTLASLLESVDLQLKQRTFEDHGITYDGLLGATDAELTDLLSEDGPLGLKIGERLALRSRLRKVKATELQEGGEGSALTKLTDGGAMGEDVSRGAGSACPAHPIV
jgi:hypothetical protein